MLDETTWRNTSKFTIFLEYENLRSFFVFHFMLLFSPIMNSLVSGLCRHFARSLHQAWTSYFWRVTWNEWILFMWISILIILLLFFLRKNVNLHVFAPLSCSIQMLQDCPTMYPTMLKLSEKRFMPPLRNIAELDTRKTPHVLPNYSSDYQRWDR